MLPNGPLLSPQLRLMPFRCRATLDSDTNDSVMLKLQSGLASRKAMSCFCAYSSASRSLTSRLKAKWQRFPTRTFGTPGACCTTIFNLQLLMHLVIHTWSRSQMFRRLRVQIKHRLANQAVYRPENMNWKLLSFKGVCRTQSSDREQGGRH